MMSDNDKRWLDEFIGGKSLQDILRWQQARALTGYDYENLVAIVADEDNEDGLTNDDLKSVDESVNLLGHLINKRSEKMLDRVEHDIISKIQDETHSGRFMPLTSSYKAVDHMASAQRSRLYDMRKEFLS